MVKIKSQCNWLGFFKSMNISAFPSCLSYFYFFSIALNKKFDILSSLLYERLQDRLCLIKHILHESLHSLQSLQWLLVVLTHLWIPVQSVGAPISYISQKMCSGINCLWKGNIFCGCFGLFFFPFLNLCYSDWYF